MFSFGEIASNMMADKALNDAAKDDYHLSQLVALLKQYGITGQKAVAFLIDFSMLDLEGPTPLLSESSDDNL